MISGIKKHLAEHIQANREELWQWQLEQARKAPPPFYCSIDLRDSGYKIVPVDSNLYPGGFNNLCPEDLKSSASILRAQIASICAKKNKPNAKKLLILPESHTQNMHYIENLYFLSEIARKAGYEVRIGWLQKEIPLAQLLDQPAQKDPLELKSFTEKKLLAYPITIQNKKLIIYEYEPDFILLNNDFSEAYPKLLDSVMQPIFPSHTLGWHSRKKSEHFYFYNQLAAECASILKIDPWLIQVDTEEVTPVNFNKNHGIEKVAQTVDQLLHRIESAYEKRKINRKPFVFIKNNAGTYGMGITIAHHAQEIRNMNRRTRTKMSTGKNRSQISSVVVQEGVPTATLVNRLAAEPVIYLLGLELIGGFLRTHEHRGNEENLNAKGMIFKKLCMSDLKNPNIFFSQGEPNKNLKKEPTLELVYGSIARLSALASGKELAYHSLEKEEIRDTSHS